MIIGVTGYIQHETVAEIIIFKTLNFYVQFVVF